MPRFPTLDPRSRSLGGSVFSALAPRIAELKGEIYPLHIGDTWMEPTEGLRMGDIVGSEEVRPHRYCDPRGLRTLLDRLVDKVRTRNRIPVEGHRNLLVTTGATGALFGAAAATLMPGDEVLLLAPYWPLIQGIVRSARATPVEVPVLHRVPLTPEDIADAVRARITPKTAALYLNTPSNPAGCVLDEACLSAIVDVARAHDLWIWSDEVYEPYCYEGTHTSIGSLAPERTLTAFSFSKAYGMAGYRCGVLAGPAKVLEAARKLITYVWYSTPTPAQLLAEAALGDAGDRWMERAFASYQAAGLESARQLGVPAPQGGTFLFLDIQRHLDSRGLLGFLEDCLEDNLILAPGSSFGPSYGSWVRVCFTCAPPDVVHRGVAKLAERLSR